MTPNVTIVTPVRERANALPGYFHRIEKIRAAYGENSLRLVVVEGDSMDATRSVVADWVAGRWWAELSLCDTGLPLFGSVVDPVRFRGLATVFNHGLQRVHGDWTDYAMLLPVDVSVTPDDFCRLVQRAVSLALNVVSPFVFQGLAFYDIWAFVGLDGVPFWGFPPSMTGALYGQQPVQMSSVGGAMLFSKAVLRAGVRYDLGDVDRGFCRAAREKGFSVWADPTVMVEHLTRESADGKPV